MKVAIFHCGFIYSGGGERIVLEEAKGLKQRGWDVGVFAPTLEPKKCFPDLVCEVKPKQFFPSVTQYIPFRNAGRMIAASLFAPFLSIWFTDVDIFIGANQPGAWMAMCMAKLLRKPYIVYLNQPNRITFPRKVDTQFGWYTTERDYDFLYKLFQKSKVLLAYLDKKSVSSAKSVLSNGRYIGGMIDDIYGVKSVDAPAGAYAMDKVLLDKDPYKGIINVKNFKIKKPYCLITNRHDPQKRFDYVIEALGIIKKKKGKNIKLVIPGPFTQHTPCLIEAAKKHGVEKQVIFTGRVTESELQLLYKNAAVYCYPSPEEDFGLGPLEAGGWRVPTVAWNHGGPTVTVDNENSGFLAKPYDLNDYADKMYTLMVSPALRHKMGAIAWKRTKDNFSWEKHLNTLESELSKFTKK